VIAAASLADLARIVSILVREFAQRGAELLVLLTLVPADWQAHLVVGKIENASRRDVQEDNQGIEQLEHPAQADAAARAECGPEYMPRLRTLAHSVIDEPTSERHVATLEQITTDARRVPPQTRNQKAEFGKLVALVKFALRDFGDFANITVAAKQLGINLLSLQKAIAKGRIQTFEISGGRKMVNLTECRVLWPDGPRPTGRPRSNS
jgi:hypothetical protein